MNPPPGSKGPDRPPRRGRRVAAAWVWRGGDPGFGSQAEAVSAKQGDEGRTFIDAYAMAVVLLLASRTTRHTHLAFLALVILLALVLVARRRVLFE